MKFVKESLDDVLKPKKIDPEELKKYLDQAKGVAQNLKDEMESTGDYAHREERLMQLYNQINDWYYTFPEFIQQNPEIEKAFSELHQTHDSAMSYIRGDYTHDESSMFFSESLLLEKAKLALSAGLVIIQDGKILLAHPTNAGWMGTFSIPKGHVEEGEELIDAAIRETSEEVGIDIDKKDVVSGPHLADYTDKRGKLFKRVYFYVVNPSQKIKKSDLKLQKDEVDWAGFMSEDDAKKRILGRLHAVLKYVK